MTYHRISNINAIQYYEDQLTTTMVDFPFYILRLSLANTYDLKMMMMMSILLFVVARKHRTHFERKIYCDVIIVIL